MNIKYLAAALAATTFATPALANNVSGPRVEAVLGWDNVSVIDESRGGFLYGIGAGYDFAVSSKSSLGIDVEYTDSTTDIEFTDGADSAKVSTGRDLYVGGRFTTAVSEKFALYAKAGYTNARIKATETVGGVTVSDAANGDGIRGGVGGQYLIGGNTYLGAEYRYSNYEGDFSRHQVAATFGVRF